MTAADYRRRLKSAQPPLTGAFLFCGGEEYLKRNALESTRAAVVGEGDAAAFNLHRYSALDAAFRKYGPSATVLAMPHGGSTLPYLQDAGPDHSRT